MALRRLPVIQPTTLERRAFLVGVVASVAACSSEPNTLGRRPAGSSGSSGSTGTSGGGGSSGGEDDDTPDATVPNKDAGLDSSVAEDSSTGPTGCAAAGKDVGAPGSFAMGTLTMNADQAVYIGRDAGGLYAMYGFCTHAIGNMNVNGGQLVCAVHGARFTLTGTFISGPGGTQSLPHYALCLGKNGNVLVDTKTEVPASTRLVA